MKTSAYESKVMQNIGFLPPHLKKRIRVDLESSISRRLERGDTYSEIEADMGSPSQMALRIVSGLGVKFERRLSVWRHVFLLFAMIPLAYIVLTVIHIIKTPTPSGFASAADLFRNLFQNNFIGILYLAVNYFLFLCICFFGYISLRYQLLLKKKHIVIMICLSLPIGIILLPSVCGIDTMSMVCNIFGIWVSNKNAVFLNILQPQNFVTLLTVLVLLNFLTKQSSLDTLKQ